MAEAHSSTIALTINATQQNAVDLNTVKDVLAESWSMALTNGIGANKAENMFHDKRTIAASGTDSLDVSGGITNQFGVSLTFTKIKLIAIRALAANTNDVGIARPASNGLPFMEAASDKTVRKPGGIFLHTDPSAAGIPVTAGTGDLIDITNEGGGTSVDYEIIIIGETT